MKTISIALIFCCFVNAASVAKPTVADTIQQIIQSALSQTKVTKYYDPAYTIINYPNGDVPIVKGVCTDVIIRAFRSVGIDFQKLIHEDMEKHFNEYPKLWKLSKPDSNIDHRRVPNIICYLKRHKKEIKITKNDIDYIPGDIVTWKLPGNLDHIGMVVNVPVENTKRFGVVHNIGNGTELEDALFLYEITGHFRYFQK